MALNLTNPLEEVIDPHRNKAKFERWGKDKKLMHISSESRNIILRYIQDMADGINVNGSNKGARSFSRLNAIRVRIPQIAGFIQKKYKKEITEVTGDEILRLFRDMETGRIRKINDEPYKSTSDYIKDFMAFWHWHMKCMKKYHKKFVEDITEDLCQNSKRKSNFRYFTVDDLKKMSDGAKYEYKIIMWFLFDSGVRAPSELVNLRVKDIKQLKNSDKLELTIRDEVSKTFGRKIKLMLSHQLTKDYIKRKKLQPEDFLFKISPPVANKYLKKIGFLALGIGIPVYVSRVKDGKEYKELSSVKNGVTLYDFRHCSACHWVVRYKQETALRYRFGWKKPEMIEYYSNFMGMKDTIQDEDLEDADTRTQLQKELESQKQKNELLEEQMQSMQKDYLELNGRLKSIEDIKRLVEIKLENT